MSRLHFGPSIKKARVKLGLTQTELGDKLKPPIARQPTVANWENEKSFPSREQTAQLRPVLWGASGENNSPETGEAVESGDVTPSGIGTWLNRHRLEKGLTVPELATNSEVSAVAIYDIESGRSQNPQQKTLAKLEKALGKTPSGGGQRRGQRGSDHRGSWRMV